MWSTSLSTATGEGDGIETTAAEDPDRALVDACRAGDQNAFHDLVRRYEARIFNFMRVSTAGDAEWEDLAQEVFIRAYRALDRFRGDSSFKTWLYAIAANVARTHATRRPRWQAVRTFFRGGDEGGEEGGVDDVDSARGVTGRDVSTERQLVQRDAIDRALATLTPDLRLVITLRDVEGLDYREISAALGVPIGTVESRLFRARQRLRPLLEPLLGR